MSKGIGVKTYKHSIIWRVFQRPDRVVVDNVDAWLEAISGRLASKLAFICRLILFEVLNAFGWEIIVLLVRDRKRQITHIWPAFLIMPLWSDSFWERQKNIFRLTKDIKWTYIILSLVCDQITLGWAVKELIWEKNRLWRYNFRSWSTKNIFSGGFIYANPRQFGNNSPSLEGKYSEHGSGRRGAPSSDGLCRFICRLEWGPGKE